MGKKNFYRDGKEIYFRCWWLVLNTYRTAVSNFSTIATSRWFDDERFVEQDTRIFIELMGYTISFVMEKLAEDIQESHDWKDEGGYTLHIDYQIYLGFALEQVFVDVHEDKNFFSDLIKAYWIPEYDDDYDKLWNIPETEVTDEDMNKTLGELIRDAMDEVKDEDYNLHKHCTFRIGKIVKIADREKVMNNTVRPYSDIGLSYYDDAFFGLSKRKIKRELKRAYRK